MRALLVAAMASVFILKAPAATRTIAYSAVRICAAPLDGNGKTKKLAEGSWPDISPDGSRIVFNTEEADTPKRSIAIVDLATGKKSIVPGIPSDNCHSPKWSPDGSQIVFYLFVDNDWQIGLIHPDGTGFHYLKRAAPKNRSFWSAAWAADGKSLFCQDLDTLYRIDLDGKILRQWSLAKLFPTAGLNSGAVLAPSPDGRTLLIDVDLGEDIPRPDWDGPPPAIFQLDLASGKVTQVTKSDLFAWNPAWINDHEILCNHMPVHSQTISIYRLSLPNGTPKLVVKDARDASVSQ